MPIRINCNMKYSTLQINLLIVCCTLCFTSCDSDSVCEPEADRGVEMLFDVASLSRAVTTEINEFSVYGDMKFHGGNAAPIVTFNKTSVVNRDGAWCYDGTQYWLPKHEHSFVAVSPSSALESEVSPRYDGSELSFAYTMPTYSDREMQDAQDKSDLIDIVAASHRRLYNEGDNVDAISLRFGHLLSMINFAPRLDDKTLKEDDYILIRKIEICGLKKKAKITILPARLSGAAQTDDNLIEFDGYEGDDNLTITFNDSRKVYNGQQINLFDDDDALIMLPQAFEASSEAIVRVTYSFKDDSENPRVGTISLSGQEWKPGISYSYSFTVDKVGLNLGNATIQKWISVSIPDIGWVVE